MKVYVCNRCFSMSSTEEQPHGWAVMVIEEKLERNQGTIEKIDGDQAYVRLSPGKRLFHVDLCGECVDKVKFLLWGPQANEMSVNEDDEEEEDED